MPGIFNIGNTYNVNNKRISSKLTFDTGEKFSGKVIKKEGSNEATIRLIDGWEFQAEVDGDLDSLGKGLTRFQVEGFENGKLKLKIIGEKVKGDELNQGDFNEIILKEGLSKEDINLLKDMVKFNIPLTKENIREIKGLIQFLNKINENPNEVKEFISKYLLSKGIGESTLEGNKINNILKDFFVEFKTLSKEDLLLFFENNIELNKENIKGFNTMFKTENSIIKLINDLSTAIPQLKTSISEGGDNVVEQLKNNINSKEVEGNINKIIKEENNIQDGNLGNRIGSGAYQKNEGNSKVSLLSILKSISGQTEDYINVGLKDILLNRRTEFTSSEFDRTFNRINKLKPEEFIKSLKAVISEFKEIGELPIDNDLGQYVNKVNNESLGITETLKFTKGELEVLLSKLMGKGINLTEDEFGKLKDGINLKYQEVIDKESPLKDILQSDKIDIMKESISENIKEMTNLKSTIEDLPTKEIIKNSINKTGEASKEILKDLLVSIKSEGITSEKIVDVLKNNINEIKLFNKVSSEYYYADIPINIKEREYPCKIIVKDKREDGKKIDSKNLKMVITIDTKNLGTVDGYMKVLDKKIDIDLKCEDGYVKIVDMAKNKLVSSIENMGFIVDVKVSKKEEEVSLTTCRDFFNSGFGVSIDRRV
ncbi:hypothetical protein [Clostridium nigeriense]|mgnify:CR=1 FL=1|uniref:hypothetical protein n=1 Tax=Clostridium nigeriense TaxID=1805470 RepID=UPI000835B315|nr:hypothetical protein [Clostridium nigeriense]